MLARCRLWPAAGWRVARCKPLAELASASRAIDVTALTRRVPVRGAGDELDDVALAFNDTLGRLERAIGDMKQFSTALAHELRTPLAALRGETELALMRSAIARGLPPRAWPASSRNSIG